MRIYRRRGTVRRSTSTRTKLIGMKAVIFTLSSSPKVTWYIFMLIKAEGGINYHQIVL